MSQPQPKMGGRPKGLKNKKGRKIQLTVDDTVDDGEHGSEDDVLREIDDEGESGCTSPAKNIKNNQKET